MVWSNWGINLQQCIISPCTCSRRISELNQPRRLGGDNRNGQKIMVRSIDLRGNRSSQTFRQRLRWLEMRNPLLQMDLMIDTQANGASLIWQMYSKKIHWWRSIDIYNSPRETGRYKILMDKVLRINELTPGWNTQTNRWHAASRLQYFQKHVNLDLPIQFSDQYGNLASVRNNNICMIILWGRLEYPNDLQLSKSYSDSLTIKLKINKKYYLIQNTPTVWSLVCVGPSREGGISRSLTLLTIKKHRKKTKL